MNLQQKKEVVKDLQERFSKAVFVVQTDYKGLNVDKINVLRKQLKENHIDYQVVKNTLLKRASDGTDVALIKDNFQGPSAVVIAYEDPVAPAKVLTAFAKENQNLQILAGVLRGKVIDATDVKAISELPPRDVLLGQMLATMNAVPTSFVRVLNKVPEGLVNVLTAIKDQKEAA